MGKRKKEKRLFGRMSIMYVTMIIALSAMGIGYATWSSGLSINVGITTGNTKRSFNMENLEYSQLNYRLSDDDMTLYITGEVNQNSNMDMPIEIKDTGSIPTILNNVDELSTTDIVNFGEQGNIRYNSRSLLAQDTDGVETFNININAIENDENIIESSINYYDLADVNYEHDEIAEIQNEIDRTKEEISNIQNEIKRLKDLREKHNFKYNLNFKQGL